MKKKANATLRGSKYADDPRRLYQIYFGSIPWEFTGWSDVYPNADEAKKAAEREAVRRNIELTWRKT